MDLELTKEPLTPERAEMLARRFYDEGGTVRVSSVSSLYDREEIIAFLRANTTAIQAEVGEMTREQLAYRLPGAPAGADASGDEAHFDTSEIVTHTATGTAFHWWNITRALRHERPQMPKPPEGSAVTGKRRDGIGAGGWSGVSGEELSAHLGRTVDDFLGYIEALPGESFSAATSSFGLFRDLTPHDWLFIVSVHLGAHLVQIRDLKRQPDYPGA